LLSKILVSTPILSRYNYKSICRYEKVIF